MALRYSKPSDCNEYEQRLNNKYSPNGSVAKCNSFACVDTPYSTKECQCSSSPNGFPDCKECLNNCVSMATELYEKEESSKSVKNTFGISVIFGSIILLIIIALIMIFVHHVVKL